MLSQYKVVPSDGRIAAPGPTISLPGITAGNGNISARIGLAFIHPSWNPAHAHKTGMPEPWLYQLACRWRCGRRRRPPSRRRCWARTRSRLPSPCTRPTAPRMRPPLPLSRRRPLGQRWHRPLLEEEEGKALQGRRMCQGRLRKGLWRPCGGPWGLTGVQGARMGRPWRPRTVRTAASPLPSGGAATSATGGGRGSR